jgi:hypothetical protein
VSSFTSPAPVITFLLVDLVIFTNGITYAVTR